MSFERLNTKKKDYDSEELSFERTSRNELGVLGTMTTKETIKKSLLSISFSILSNIVKENIEEKNIVEFASMYFKSEWSRICGIVALLLGSFLDKS